MKKLLLIPLLLIVFFINSQIVLQGVSPSSISGTSYNFEWVQPGGSWSAVVLLLHQQIHLVQPVKGRAVFVNVVLQRLLEAQHGNAALVLERVAHGRCQS